MNKIVIFKSHVQFTLTSTRCLHKNHIQHTFVKPEAYNKFEHEPYDLHRLEEKPATQSDITREQALSYITQMHAIRKMETACSHLYLKKTIRGFCHLYAGQEACAVGIKAVMRPQDSVITSYRCHAWPVLMESTLEKGITDVIAELVAKRSGSSGGKGGSMHIYAKGFYGGNGIVGGHVPLGTGIAFSHKYKKDGGVCFTLYGDGAANNGQVSEAFNMAKLYNLPVIYVVENNNYGMGTSTARSSANQNYYTRGDLIPGIRTNGMDVLTVREAMKFAVKHVQDEKGPIIIELMTYRYFGHSMSDPGISYRSREEVKTIRDTFDPIKLLREKMIATELATENELKEIDKNTKDLVDKCEAEALKAADPEMGDLYTHVTLKSFEKPRACLSDFIKTASPARAAKKLK